MSGKKRFQNKKVRKSNLKEEVSEESGPSDLTSDLHHQKSENSSFFYLKQAATEAEKKLKKRLYKEKSYIPENLDRERLRTIKEANKKKEKNMKKEKNKKEGDKNVLGRASLLIQKKPRQIKKEAKKTESAPPENEIIRSFSDFDDSLFEKKTINGVVMFCCAKNGCNKQLPTISRIKRHYISHTDIKPFVCPSKSCSKKFSRKDNMLQHYKAHCKKTKKYD
ncbi:zinc finger C2H2 domain-containing protein [Vairimorpha necatrix]|uniref:Zinc finger C2H2 domain-containing protein n=1 Tax=Vairimorpha necatrix TaxID=6039 RepID=A0AAX4JDN7_9MICR